MVKSKLIIDCDAGVDDAQAILIALADPSVEVLAITCVAGNVSAENVSVNVLKVLELCERTDIPVHRGANVPLLGKDEERAEHFHGEDGLGDASDIQHPDISLLKTEHAVEALIRLAKEHPGEITLVAIGPLTNVALACRLDSNLTTNLKEVVIMGGNIEGKGNASVSGEFNFHQDPEAVHVVLNEVTCPVTMVTWEVCLNHGYEWNFYDKYTSLSTKKSEFVRKITEKPAKFYRAEYAGMGRKYTSCDPLAMAVAIQPELVLHKESIFATIELQGHFTRGQMVVDWRGTLKKKHNVTLIRQVDMKKVMQLLLESLQ